MANELRVLPGSYSVVKYAPQSPLPTGLDRSAFSSVSRSSEELSVVWESRLITEGYEAREDGWKCLKVEGKLDFSLTGILASIVNPLAEARISIFALSTFDTDYVLVKEEQLSRAKEVLAQAGFAI